MNTGRIAQINMIKRRLMSSQVEYIVPQIEHPVPTFYYPVFPYQYYPLVPPTVTVPLISLTPPTVTVPLISLTPPTVINSPTPPTPPTVTVQDTYRRKMEKRDPELDTEIEEIKSNILKIQEDIDRILSNPIYRRTIKIKSTIMIRGIKDIVLSFMNEYERNSLMAALRCRRGPCPSPMINGGLQMNIQVSWKMAECINSPSLFFWSFRDFLKGKSFSKKRLIFCPSPGEIVKTSYLGEYLWYSTLNLYARCLAVSYNLSKHKIRVARKEFLDNIGLPPSIDRLRRAMKLLFGISGLPFQDVKGFPPSFIKNCYAMAGYIPRYILPGSWEPDYLNKAEWLSVIYDEEYRIGHDPSLILIGLIENKAPLRHISRAMSKASALSSEVIRKAIASERIPELVELFEKNFDGNFPISMQWGDELVADPLMSTTVGLIRVISRDIKEITHTDNFTNAIVKDRNERLLGVVLRFCSRSSISKIFMNKIRSSSWIQGRDMIDRAGITV